MAHALLMGSVGRCENARAALRAVLEQALHDSFELETRCDTPDGKTLRERYALVALHADFSTYSAAERRALATALIEFVAQGGTALRIQAGTASWPELDLLFGARVLYTLPRAYLTLRPQGTLLSGIPPYEVQDSPCPLLVDPFAELETLLYHDYAHAAYPALFSRRFGLGRALWLTLGEEGTLVHPSIRRAFHRIGMQAANMD